MYIVSEGLLRHLFSGTDAVPGTYMGTVVLAPGEVATSAQLVERAGLDGGVRARVRTVRKRFTIAQINAGATILPAVANVAYRMVDSQAVAYGGAVGATTTVDVLGTQSTSKKLVAYGQAALTQSTVLRPGISGATVLADGASFVANDANTAITIGKTGSDLTTATGVDVQVTYEEILS